MFPFHTATEASFFSCGEDQTAAWSEVAGHNQQAALSFDGGAAVAIVVSTDLVRQDIMKGYSHFTDTRPRLDLCTRSQRLGQRRVWVAQSRDIRPQPQLLI
jgi:hypothetical protein